MIRSKLFKRFIGRFFEKKIKEATGAKSSIEIKKFDITHNESAGAPYGALVKIELEGFVEETELNKLITKLGF